LRRGFALVVALLACSNAIAAGHLTIEHAWIRTPPPGAMMLAGYATLRNDGDAPLTISGADSTAFGSVSLHQTVSDGGVERMRALGEFRLAPGESVTFAPGGKHLMLMRPQKDFAAGESAAIHMATTSGDGATATFVVGDAAP
jgi:copper(I)-binding protein